MNRASHWNKFAVPPPVELPAPASAPDVVAPSSATTSTVAPPSVTRRQQLRLPHPRRWAARFPLTTVALCAALAGGVINLLLGTDPWLNPDSHSFEAIARSLLAGTGFVYREPMFPSLPLYAFRSPGYSAFLALGLALGGVSAVVALQGAMHGVAAALVGSIAGRWAGARGAWLAFAMYMAWPAAWFHAGQLMSESFFTFSMILTSWLVLRAKQHHGLRWAAAAGVVVAIAILTRPAGLGFAAGAGLWLLLRYPRAAAVFALSAVLAWAPWPIRNASRFHTFVPFLTGGGVAAWNAHSHGRPIDAWTWMSQHTERGELGLDQHFRDETVKIIREDVPGFFHLMARGTLEYLGPLRERDPGAWLHRFALLALLPAALWANWRRRLLLPALVWSGYALVLIPHAMHARYRFPTEWCVVVGAAIGLQAMAVHWGARRTAGLAVGALLLCIAFTVVVARA